MHTIRGVCAIIDQNEDQVLKLVTDGVLSPAFEIGLGRKCSEVRVLPAAIVLFQAGVPNRLTWDEVASSLVPEMATAKPGVVVTITGSELQRVLNCSCSHIQALLDCGQLKRITESKPGKGGSPKISAESFLKFLYKRRFPN